MRPTGFQGGGRLRIVERMADDDASKVRRVLEEALSAARKDWLLGTVLTVVLAPVFAAAALVGLVIALSYSGGVDVLNLSPAALPVVLEVFLVYMTVGLFFGEKRKVSGSLIAGALAGIAALAVLAHATTLRTTAPAPFWTVYGLGVAGILGLMGYGYAPRDDYYLGLTRYQIDNPFTLRDDVDRAHVGLGFAAAAPQFVLGAIGGIFDGSWALAGLEEREVVAASRALLGLARGDPKAFTPVSALGPTAAARIMRALVGCKLLAAGAAVARLSTQGQRLLATSGASLSPPREGFPTDADSPPRGDPSRARSGRDPGT